MKERFARWGKRLLAGLALWTLLGAGCARFGMRPLRDEALRPFAGTRGLGPTPELALARRFAPVLFHAFHQRLGRQDVPTAFDFDGNLRGDDNWESFPHFALEPTVYYTLVESETHWFLTYHLFHPRDWSKVDLGLHLTHENDGENLQVVVEKARERPVLLYTQAHYRSEVHADPSVLPSGTRNADGLLVCVDSRGIATETARHAAAFVEWGGHGIFGMPHGGATAGRESAAPAFSGAGWILYPASETDVVREPELASGTVPYRLASLHAAVAGTPATGEHVGRDGLFDGVWQWTGPGQSLGVPRFYQADRFSGPFGPDRGISPFAVDFDWNEGTLGSLLFAPARRWAERFPVLLEGGWSLEEIRSPWSL